LRIKEQETRLTHQELDDDDDALMFWETKKLLSTKVLSEGVGLITLLSICNTG